MSVLAIDIGAGSGRALLAELNDGQLQMKEIHRFSNDPVRVNERLHWDILRLFYEIKQAISKATQSGAVLHGVAVDSWAVDFGLLGKDGELLRNPYHYRDHFNEGIMEKIHDSLISKEELFSKTGIQFLPFNTIYQLAALKEKNGDLLHQADSLLMIPDLIRYFLTGVKKSEFTNATTTQLYNPIKMEWDNEILETLGISKDLFHEVVVPGTIIGPLSNNLCEELEVPAIPVIAVGEHDTASAVAGVPALDESFAYLSCGTWSLMGTEVRNPVMNKSALAMNFTNEGGVEQRFRLLKNIMGLWILEECRRNWGEDVDYASLLEEAEEAPPFRSFIDPDYPPFLNPADMPRQVQVFCEQTKQPVPETRGEMVRCIIESLAMKYRYVLERTERLAEKEFYGLHMVGGGIKNQLLCQFTSNALGKPVWAGPAEASAIGNVLVQLITIGQIEGLDEARKIALKATDMEYYFPEQKDEWSLGYEQFCHKAMKSEATT
ncbi:rhamnulokinase [Halobacillus campisalis]|uniref:Rhamnulokinase family protein n=1 Tax=Halobacillus campisalis TaxID=435909 RepID=A0ABW2K9D0_9BACI|nr:rhamnulokinase family protein [Halobacillus campisalis]